MMPTRPKALGLFALLLAFIVGWVSPSQALDDELIGQHLEPLLPDEVSAFTLEDVDPADDRAAVRAVYQPDAEEEPINFALAYGEEAAELYRKLRARFVMVEVDTEVLSVQGRTFAAGQMGSDLFAFNYSDHFLVVARYQDLDAEADSEELTSSLIDFLEAFDLNRLAEWTPPEGVEYALDEDTSAETSDIANCYDMECFGENVSRCEKAQLVGALGRKVTAMYTVEEPVEGDRCRLSLVFTDNPNPDFEGTPLYFTVDSEDAFELEDLRNVLEDCFEGDGDNCEGPLLDVMGSE